MVYVNDVDDTAYLADCIAYGQYMVLRQRYGRFVRRFAMGFDPRRFRQLIDHSYRHFVISHNHMLRQFGDSDRVWRIAWDGCLMEMVFQFRADPIGRRRGVDLGKSDFQYHVLCPRRGDVQYDHGGKSGDYRQHTIDRPNGNQRLLHQYLFRRSHDTHGSRRITRDGCVMEMVL